MPDAATAPPPAPFADSLRFGRAWSAIDAANADDPETLMVRGVERPKELAHAELMVEWVMRLDPDASELQVLAARAHHLRRWALPRADFPEGRAGYLRWRTELKRRHAADAAALLAAAGYDNDEIDQVGRIISKDGLRRGAVTESISPVQVHEDALCLVFLETQFSGLIDRLGRDKAVEVTAKTLGKMSPAAIDAAAGLDLTPTEQDVLAAAVAGAGR